LPEPGPVLRFLNNNDTGERFITRHGVERTRVAAAMLFTLPGMPLIYNGDEVGAEFKPYDEQPISWQDRHGLVPYYARLTELRKTTPALTSPHMEIVATDRDEAVLAYVRTAPADAGGCADGDRVLVLLNFTAEPVDVRLPAAASTAPFLEDSGLRDMLSGEAMAVPRSAPFKLKPFDARVVVRGDPSC
jgi:glycosidase